MSDVLSVGIDIGTSTVQVSFSRLSLENTASSFSVPKIAITDKEILYRGEPCSTPLLDAFRLDGEKIRQIVAGEFSKAGFDPRDTKTGAVIITGESARKDNAELVLQKLSDFAGNFVVSTAGPDLESSIAGMGSGACAFSAENDCCTINLDIGGGTTNIAVFQNGEVVSCGCYDIGGRLICVDKSGTLTKVSASAERIGRVLGLELVAGRRMSVDDLRAVTDKMASLLSQALGLEPTEPFLDMVITSGSSRLSVPPEKPARICFSGGVADFIYNTSETLFPYGDIGALLGESVRRSALYEKIPVLHAHETISATVVGAGTHTTSISGSTVSVDASVLPQKNIPVFRLNKKIEEECMRSGDERLLREPLLRFLKQHDSPQLVLAIDGPANPEYETLQRLSAVIAEAMDAVLPKGEAVLLVSGEDIAMALGLTLRRALEGRRKCVVLDGLQPKGESYMDLGQPLAGGLVVPVIMKTLIFG